MKSNNNPEENEVNNDADDTIMLTGAEGALLDQVCADDAAYFEANPGESERLRPMIEGEFYPEAPPEVVPGCEMWVEVAQLAPGLRTRRPAYQVVLDGPSPLDRAARRRAARAAARTR
jgi:hypothetical protein